MTKKDLGGSSKMTRLVLVDNDGKVHTIISNINEYDLKRPIAQAAICNKIHDGIINMAITSLKRKDND
jgi:hypothetical protein